MIKTTERLDEAEVAIIVELMKSEYSTFENQELSAMADQISSVFNRHCTVEDLETHYSDAEVENFETESSSTEEVSFYNNVDEYESRDRFS